LPLRGGWSTGSGAPSAHPQAIDRSFATPTISAFLPVNIATGSGMSRASVTGSLRRHCAAGPRPPSSQRRRMQAASAPSRPRLVRMIGTRAPTHDASCIGTGEKRQALGQHVPGFEVGHYQHVGPAGSDQQFVADSPLERTGFELPVPWKTPGVLVRGGYVSPRLFLAKRNPQRGNEAV